MHAYSILNLSTGTQILEHEETTQLSPSTTRTISTYESRRRLGSGQRSLDTVRISSNYDESGLKMLSPRAMSTSSDISEDYFVLNEEMYIACAMVNESLYDNHVDKKKVVRIN